LISIIEGDVMGHRHTLLAASAALALPIVAAASAGAAVDGRTARLAPPVITESFTPLPCSGAPGSRTTQQMEGCAERQILRSDGMINVLSARVFARLTDDAARRRFIAAHRAWLAYRQADCLSRSDVFEGGTEAPVLFAQCAASRNAQRIKDLRTFLSDLGG
jgi:uncharacterized protein YecT (DUF1311 family)